MVFNAPLLEAIKESNKPLKRGWTARRSDRESITYSNTFKSERDFESALEQLKQALGDKVTIVEWGRVADDFTP